MLSVTVNGMTQADSGLERFAAQVVDLRAFWPRFAKGLSDESQRLWPLRRRSGRLLRSLVWAGSRLGRGGIFESSPDRLRVGSDVFYSRFHQFGAKHTPRRPLIHVDEKQHVELLAEWLRSRASASGLEIVG